MTTSRTGAYRTGMKLTLDSTSRVNLIRSYSATEIRIGERVIQRSCVVTADDVVTDWAPETLDQIQPAHLDRLFELKPELVLVGTGPVQRFAPAWLRSAFTDRGIGIESMDLGAACRTFNILVQEERPVAAALFLV